MSADFRHIHTWIFDLDNTLYPASTNLFAQVDRRMAEFIMAALDVPMETARRLQKGYYHSHGTTLNGLMREHGLPPEPFLAYVHDIDLTPVAPNPRLRAAIARLPGRRLVHTNGSRRHAERVASRIGIDDLFEDIFCIAAADYCAKPAAPAYEAFIARHGVAPTRAAMFEDMGRNLEVPHALGMTTVLVTGEKPWEKEGEAPPAASHFAHHTVEDLPSFLAGLVIEAPDG